MVLYDARVMLAFYEVMSSKNIIKLKYDYIIIFLYNHFKTLNHAARGTVCLGLRSWSDDPGPHGNAGRWLLRRRRSLPLSVLGAAGGEKRPTLLADCLLNNILIQSSCWYVK
jgi:hypothetical protein